MLILEMGKHTLGKSKPQNPSLLSLQGRGQKGLSSEPSKEAWTAGPPSGGLSTGTKGSNFQEFSVFWFLMVSKEDARQQKHLKRRKRRVLGGYGTSEVEPSWP